MEAPPALRAERSGKSLSRENSAIAAAGMGECEFGDENRPPRAFMAPTQSSLRKKDLVPAAPAPVALGASNKANGAQQHSITTKAADAEGAVVQEASAAAVAAAPARSLKDLRTRYVCALPRCLPRRCPPQRLGGLPP